MVHAFSPQTCLKPNYVKRHRRLDQQWKADAYERLWASPDAAPDLFDLKADPHQQRNLAEDPGHAKALEELRAKLLAFEEGKRQ